MTPLNYSEEKYSVYFEVFPSSIQNAKNIIDDYIGNENFITEKYYGLVYRMNVQTIPNVIRELLDKNIAVYGVIPDYLLQAKEQKVNRNWLQRKSNNDFFNKIWFF